RSEQQPRPAGVARPRRQATCLPGEDQGVEREPDRDPGHVPGRAGGRDPHGRRRGANSPRARGHRREPAQPLPQAMNAARRLLAAGLAVAIATAGMAVAQPTGAAPQVTAVLQGLDKITARISTIEAPVDEEVAFGDLKIVARACQKRPPEEPPESAAFLEIREVKPDKEPAMLFSGWMFASSPAVSALDHPVYDVWVLDCKPA